MKRRTFILLTATGVAVVGATALYKEFDTKNLDPSLTEPELLYNIWEEQDVLEIGEAYRQLYPEENRHSLLVKRLRGLNEDFASDETVFVAGWVLSRTEARQCALYSLSLPK